MPPSRTRNSDAEILGAILQRLRLERGWTLRKLALRLGMNPVHLGVLERGGNMPSLATVFEIAEVFNVEASQLVAAVERGRKAVQAENAARMQSARKARTAGGDARIAGDDDVTADV